LHTVDGKEIIAIDDNEILEQCRLIKEKGIKHIVIVGVFSPLAATGEQEEYVKKVITGFFKPGYIEVVCSKDGAF